MGALDRVARFLKAQSILALATRSAQPQVAPLFYLAGPGVTLYWFSSASAAHSKSLTRDPAAAVTIFRPTTRWREIRGVQMRGRVSVVDDPDERRAVAAAYTRRFHLGRACDPVLSRSRLYVFKPSWIRYMDNRGGFGGKTEIAVAR